MEKVTKQYGNHTVTEYEMSPAQKAILAAEVKPKSTTELLVDIIADIVIMKADIKGIKDKP